jgi:hypothetical protein
MAVIDNTAAYVAIAKFEEQEDGTLMVFGKATDQSLDADQQICDPEWLKNAMPEWFKYGNIREQHSSIAAGVATEYEHREDGHYISAHVIDPNSVKKVKARVLKGFSIGIKGPRVVKDNKAAGGRIIDGSIVEISLVDRPANPACMLTMAKSVGFDVVKTEEYTENLDNHASHIIETSAKFSAGDITKFDQAAFDDARRALATLIQVEAEEMKQQGGDEIYSLACLLSAVHSLMEWYEGEVHEGEVAPMPEMEQEMEMAIEPENVKENPFAKDHHDEKMCDKCNKSMDECKCSDMKSEDPDTAVKCLECGCHQPANDHGRDDVTTAVIVESGMKSDNPEVSDIRSIVEDIVKSLLPVTESTGGESVVTKSAESERIEALESELEQVKALAAPSGPRRMGVVSNTTPNANLTKAAMYRAKADTTLDKALADGYRQMAADLETETN